MHIRKRGELTLLEAVDDLAHMAEVDQSPPQDGPTHDVEPVQTLSWQDPEHFTYSKERAIAVFRSIINYLQSLFEEGRQELSDPEIQRGIQALMVLTSEAVQKMDGWLKKSGKEESLTELAEYKELQQFYLTKIVQKFEGIVESVEIPEELAKRAKTAAFEIKQPGLKDVGAVRSDKEYELFAIKKRDGTPFFSRGLLRHMYLVRQCEALLPELAGEDPLVRMKGILDRDLHLSAKGILHLAAPYIESYYKDAMQHKSKGFVAALNKALMALMLASNNRNLLQNTIGKSCLDYYSDFHFYLREALTSKEYQHFILHPPKPSESFSRSLIHLLHVLCSAFFLRVSAKEEMASFIRLLIERGGEGSVTEEPTHTPLLEWETLLDEDEHLRFFLTQYPNSPLKKALDLFTEEKALKGFDPIGHGNFPSKMYMIENGTSSIACIRLGSPTFQESINKAQVVDEFRGFLRSKNYGRTLVINLQDRTSWLEHARSVAIEELQKEKEFEQSLMVITLPKHTDFYMQVGPYFDLNDAATFKDQFLQQIMSGEVCGFSFPHDTNKSELHKFLPHAIDMIHKVFFGSKELLLQKNRLDFIEILYLLLVLKVVELFQPEMLSFTCKDAIDTGPAESAELFAFLRMLHNPAGWTQEEKSLLLWMVYSPALLSRERVIDIQRFSRMIGALSVVQAEVEAHFPHVVESCSDLYEGGFFQSLTVKPIEPMAA